MEEFLLTCSEWIWHGIRIVFSFIIRFIELGDFLSLIVDFFENKKKKKKEELEKMEE